MARRGTGARAGAGAQPTPDGERGAGRTSAVKSAGTVSGSQRDATTSGAPLRNTCEPRSTSVRPTTDMRWWFDENSNLRTMATPPREGGSRSAGSLSPSSPRGGAPSSSGTTSGATSSPARDGAGSLKRGGISSGGTTESWRSSSGGSQRVHPVASNILRSSGSPISLPSIRVSEWQHARHCPLSAAGQGQPAPRAAGGRAGERRSRKETKKRRGGGEEGNGCGGVKRLVNMDGRRGVKQLVNMDARGAGRAWDPGRRGGDGRR